MPGSQSMAGPEHSLDEERPLSSTRQVSWLPAHRFTRAFPSFEDSGLQRAANRLQWRLRSGFSPLSLFTPVYRARRADWHSRLNLVDWPMLPVLSGIVNLVQFEGILNVRWHSGRFLSHAARV